MSTANKASATRSATRSGVVAARSRASSNGDAHAEYSTSTIRNPFHHLGAERQRDPASSACRHVSSSCVDPDVHVRAQGVL